MMRKNRQNDRRRSAGCIVVYALKNVSDFLGTYTKLEASVAVGGGVGGYPT